MKICQHHWDMLREAIKARGLDHLVARSGEEACDNAVAELQGGDATYDPLMSCNNRIWSKGLELGGLYLMGQKEDGTQYCPICEALDHLPPPPGWTREDCEKFWIDGPANAALEDCRERGLAPPQQ